MDQLIPIYLKALSGEAVKLAVTLKQTVGEIKQIYRDKKQLAQEATLKFTLRGKEMQEAQTLGEAGVKAGDQIIILITQPKGQKALAPTKSQSTQLNAQSIETAEEFKKAVDDLIQLGFKREDVIQCLRQSNKNLKEALCILISNEKKYRSSNIEEEVVENSDQEERQMRIATLKENPLVQELIKSIKCSPEIWQKTLQSIQMTNIKLYNEIMNNEDAFFHELVELSDSAIQEEFEIISAEDAKNIAKICEIDRGIPQSLIIQKYIENHKNLHDTVIALNLTKV